jgi:FMN phosphatase YigB (HAD superfamily)
VGVALGFDVLITLPSTYELVSLDVFDTLLTRRYLEPKHLFWEVEHHLEREGFDSRGWAEARIAAELECRRRKQFSAETSYDEIYAELAQQYSPGAPLHSRAMALELELEVASLGPVRSMVEALELLRSNGQAVCFTSDIYLPEAFLRERLRELGVSRPGDRYLISSSSGDMKANGRLFRRLLQESKLKPSEICHVGDSFESDVRQAEAAAIRSFHVCDTATNRYESNPGEDRLVRLMLGAARYTRLSGSRRQSPRNRTIWDTTANVSAPMMFTFVNWCLREAINRGIKDLYFFARDGQVLYKMAKRIVKRHYADRLRVHYLYVSRQALLFPSLYQLSDEDFGWILAPTSFLSTRIILRRLNMEPSDFESDLRDASLWTRLDEHLEDDERRALAAILKTHEGKILQLAARYRERAQRYFTQAGLTEASAAGIVDIGWSGTLQRSLARMFAGSQKVTRLSGFYFGLARRLKHSPDDELNAWFTSPEEPAQLASEVYIIPMTELYTAADHGGCDRYEITAGGTARPILRKERNTAALAWGVATQHEAMVQFAETALKMLSADDLQLLPDAFREKASENFRSFLTEPTLEEAQAYCAYEDAEDQTEAYSRPMGRAYDFHELLEFFTSDFAHHHNEWRQGSLALSHAGLADLARRMACVSSQ